MKTMQQKRFRNVTLLLLTILLVFLILHLDRINNWLDYLAYLLRPLLVGLVLAYLCNPIFRMFEHKLFFNVRPHGFRRMLSLLFTYLPWLILLAVPTGILTGTITYGIISRLKKSRIK